MNKIDKISSLNEKSLNNDYETHILEWKQQRIDKTIETLSPFGKVLEIGFNLTSSSDKICSYGSVKEYNVIEYKPNLWSQFETFKENWKIKRPDLSINLIKGRWEDVLITTDIYDCIYFDDDTLCENTSNLVNFTTKTHMFLYEILKTHTKIGSKISYCSINDNYEIFKPLKCVNVNLVVFQFKPSHNIKYTEKNQTFIPIFIKISEIDTDFLEKITQHKNSSKKSMNGLEKITREIEKQTRRQKLFEDIKTRSPTCGLIVVDNFYSNPYETREFILTQNFLVRGNYPGQRTISYANDELRETIQKYVEPFGGKIIDFPIPKKDGSDASKIYNGSFQFTTSRERSWIHIDDYNNWAAVVYLTPNAPLSSGTAFYKFYDSSKCKKDMEILENKEDIDKYSQDMTKWEKVDSVGNIFNRMVLFNSNNFHMSMDYFGDSKENGRLFQVFFFSTER